MDAKESLCTLLETVIELNKKVSRSLLIDFVTGNISTAIKEQNLDNHELFGNGDKHDEEYYTLLIDQALTDKYLKSTDSELSVTVKGKKFLKAPTPYEIESGEDQEEPDSAVLEDLSELDSEDDDSDDEHPMTTVHTTESIGSHAKTKIQLIQAMDRKIALDDFAEQNNMEFDEVLDILESLNSSGRRLDINYFVDEVLGKESLDELFAFFDSTKGDMAKANNEFGDVYEPEEIRLARLAWENKQ